ncbi:MAG: deoxyribodipyrimidine photolyase, partial [Myxococcota bacterium]
MRSTVPAIRIKPCNSKSVRADGDFVLYWMIAARRVRDNFALDHAVAWAREFGKPLVVVEALRSDYRWASDRLHAFILDGMADNAAALDGSPFHYYPYVEPERGAGKGLLEALSARACVIVTDDFPCFFVPRMVAAAAARVSVRMDKVDGNGIYPMDATERVFTTAASFRRHLQKELPAHLDALPRREPWHGKAGDLPTLSNLPAAIRKRWPRASRALLGDSHRGLADLPIDHSVGAVATRGGARSGEAVLRRFLAERLGRYADGRNQPEDDVASGLSPYLHFGHISVHRIFRQLMERDGWSPDKLAAKA